jgi:hypothetical protein
MSAGQVITGGWVSVTVTVKLQLVELPAASVTEQLTVVVPFGNDEPEAGEQFGAPTPVQLSPTAGAEKVTFAEHCPAAAGVVTFEGQVMAGD